MGDCKGEELSKAERWTSTLLLRVILEDSHGKKFALFPKLDHTALSFRDQLKVDEVYVLFLRVYQKPEDKPFARFELETFNLRLR